MARVLLGWELGAGRGHVERLLQIAEGLLDRGHEPVLALQDMAHVSPARLARLTVVQAPIWPRLLVSQAFNDPRPVHSMADILLRLGLDRGETLAALVAGWRAMIAMIRPDVALSDYAPALTLSARGRVPLVQRGTGFSLPPHDAVPLPSLTGQRATDESVLLEGVNSGLRLAGLEPLPRFAALFGGERIMVQAFAELDPYADLRTTAHAAPAVADPAPVVVAGEGEEVFVYGHNALLAHAPLWQALGASGLRIRAHLPRIAPGNARALERLGIVLEPRPLPFDTIAERSRLLVSHGGHGISSSALLAGLPHVIVHHDLEKQSFGRALARHGMGGHVALGAIGEDAFVSSLRTYFDNRQAHARVRAKVSEFRRRLGAGMVVQTVEAIESLA